MAEAKLEPIRLQPKEGLAIVNGTAVSCAVGALALHDAHGLAVLSQAVTAMSVEALLGTEESFDALFAKVRPHPGQVTSSLSPCIPRADESRWKAHATSATSSPDPS